MRISYFGLNGLQTEKVAMATRCLIFFAHLKLLHLHTNFDLTLTNNSLTIGYVNIL